MSDDANSDIIRDKKPTQQRRPPYLIRSTGVGLVFGLAVGVVYMVLAWKTGGGVKGAEWLFFAVVGSVLGVLVGFVLDGTADD